MYHFSEFAAWFWSIGEKPENAHLYLPPGENPPICDLRAEMARWDRMYERDSRMFDRKWKKEYGVSYEMSIT